MFYIERSKTSVIKTLGDIGLCVENYRIKTIGSPRVIFANLRKTSVYPQQSSCLIGKSSAQHWNLR